MAIARITRVAELVQLLEENNVPHLANLAAQLVDIPVTHPPLAAVVHIRWEKNLPYVQIILPFVRDVPADRVPAVETAVCRANTAIALPGLGYEHNRRFVYMRLCIQTYGDGMLASAFQRQLMGAIKNAQDFVLAFRDIVAGQPGEQVMALATKHAAR